MQDTDFIEFGVVIQGIAEAFGCDISTERIAIYFEYLIDLTAESISFAASEVIKNDDKFPTVATIRRYAKTHKPLKTKGFSDLPRTVLPEFTDQQHEQAAKRFEEFLESFAKWGNA